MGTPATIESPRILFRVSFEQNKLDANLSVGRPGATVLVSPNARAAGPQFAPGLSGSALVIGEGIEVQYDLEKNVRHEQGTLTCWMRRIDPRPEATGEAGSYRYDLLRWD